MKNPNGDLELAAEYMKKAGYASGKYDGPALLMVGDNQPPSSVTGEAVQGQLEKLGFKFNYRQVSRPTMFSKFCGVAEGEGRGLPERRLGQGLLRRPVAAGPGLQRQEHRAGRQRQLVQRQRPRSSTRRIDNAVGETDPAKRAQAVRRDRQAWSPTTRYVIPWLWDNQVNIASKNVKGVIEPVQLELGHGVHVAEVSGDV